VITLQRLVGNAAVAELLAGQRAGEAGAAVGAGEAAGAAPPGAEAKDGAAPGSAAESAAGAGADAAAGMPGLAGVAGEAAAVGAAGAAPGAAGAAAEGVAAGAADAAAEGAAAATGGAAPGVAGAAAAGVGGAAPGAVGAAAEGAAAAAGGAAPGAAGAVAEGAAGAGLGAAEAAAEGAAAGAGPGAVAAAAEGAAEGAAGGAPGQEGATAGGAAKKGGEAAAKGAAGGPAKEAGAAHGAAGGATGAVAGGHHAGVEGAPESAGAPAAEGVADAGTGGAAGPAEAAARRDPETDPNFQKMKGAAAAAGGRAKVHEPAAAGASAAQGAAHAPGNDVASQAQAAQVEEMAQQQPGTFDRAAFIAAVRKAIDAAAPKNLEEADDFKGSGKVAAVKGEVGDLVKGGKKDSEKDIKQATDAAPDTGKAEPKEVVPMKPDAPEAPSASVGAAGAIPGPRPPEETDLSQGPAEVDKQMHDADVTEEQLQKSNEPEFTGALAARQDAKAHSATAPAGYRAQEQDILAKGRTEAQVAEGMHLKGMHGSKMTALAKAHGQKDHAKSEDEAKRAKVAADIQGIYDRTKADVTGILTGLDGKVESMFSTGEESARKDFENYVGDKMDAYKDDRYGGLFGGAKWLKDKLFGMPDEVNVFYTQGRDRYLAAMDGVIGKVADLVGSELAAARLKIAKGRAQVHDYVTQLPKMLQKVGKDAEGKLGSQWEALSGDIDSKQEALVDTIAQKYVASRDALDSRIEELKAANRGLVAKALDAVVGVVKTILKLKDMLLNVLAKAASVIGDIISDPIGFLGNLIDGVKSGLSRFVDNIGTHLKEGFFGWLFGAIGSAGITMPKTFDLSGIFELVMDVLGLSYRAIRARVARVVGGPVVDKMEQTVDVFKMLVTKGAAGLWDWIKEKIGDFEDMVLGGIKEWVIEKVIKGGITWLLSLLNPAAAFIKACKAIYDIVMFIVERGAQIIEFVNSVLDSIGAIAKGNISAAADKVENALAKAIPLAISFLASLLGLGGISEKIKEGIDKVRKPIEKVVDTVVMGAVKTFRKMLGPAVDWVKNKATKGAAWVKGKAAAGKQWVTDKARGMKDRVTGGGSAGGAGEQAQPAGGQPAGTPTAAKDGGDAVKAKVRAELAGEEATPVDSQEALDARLVMLMEKYRPEGLLSLRTVADPNDPTAVMVDAEASPTVGVGRIMALIPLPEANFPELTVSLDVFSQETHLFYDHPKGGGETTSGGGRHAEWNFDREFRAWIDKNPGAYAPGETINVTARLNRTPCGECADVLRQLQEHGHGDRKINLTVLSSSPYGGKKFERRLMEGRPDKVERVPYFKSPWVKLEKMRAAGVQVGVWDIWEEIRDALPEGTVLKEADQEVLRHNLAARDQVEGFLKQLERRMALPRYHQSKKT
jgi:hypothetical protein